MDRSRFTRREFARLSAAVAVTAGCARLGEAAAAASTAAAVPTAGAVPTAADAPALPPLAEFPYGDISVASQQQKAQLDNTHEVLMGLSEDSLLKPFRQMAGLPAPGADLGGWYNYDPNYDWHKDDAGFAPGCTFGQWVSALARYYAITGAEPVRAKVLRLNRLYAGAISEAFFDNNRFPAYCYDKLLLGLIDSHQLAGDPDALAMLERTTQLALPHLPPAAIDREVDWRPDKDKDQSYRWDESYTNPENFFIAYRRGAGRRYRDLAVRYLDDATWFDPLARGENVLGGKHAYSYVNSLCSAMQAYLTLDSEKHLRAARNAFTMLLAQSFPTGGWGPDEKLVAPDSDRLYASLSSTHNSFETPCGSYAHFKLTRYLLRVTHDSGYGDSMERVMYNTVLGAKPMYADGRAFYYADYNFAGRKVFSNHRFPCCSGTLPQVAADYGINAYLRDARGVYVNLYLRSQVRWTQGAARCSLQQSGEYPFDDAVTLRVRASQPVEFELRLRIPEWTRGARVEINGQRWAGAVVAGRFASIRRSWREGDRIDLELPRPLRLEPLDQQHPDTVALLCGPLVLFAVTPAGSLPRPRREELLAARQVGNRWETRVGSDTLTLLPFTVIGEEQYATVLKLAGDGLAAGRGWSRSG